MSKSLFRRRERRNLPRTPRQVIRELHGEIMSMPAISIRRVTNLLIELANVYRPLTIKRRVALDIMRNIVEYTNNDLMHPSLLVTVVLSGQFFDFSAFCAIMDKFRSKMINNTEQMLASLDLGDNEAPEPQG